MKAMFGWQFREAESPLMLGSSLLFSDKKQLKLSDLCFRRRVDNVDARPRGGVRCEAHDSLVTKRVAGEDGLPTAAVPNFNPEGLNVLAVVQPLHDQSMIESHRLRKINLQQSMVRASRRRPERIRIVVQAFSVSRSCHMCSFSAMLGP